MLQVEAPEGLQPPLRLEERHKVEGQWPRLPVVECSGAEAPLEQWQRAEGLQLRLFCEECSGAGVLVGFQPHLRVEDGLVE